MANVIVVLYDHLHGTDVNVYASMALAQKEMAQICVENIDQGELDHFAALEENRPKIAKAWKAKDYAQVITLYQAVCDYETFEFNERPIIE